MPRPSFSARHRDARARVVKGRKVASSVQLGDGQPGEQENKRHAGQAPDGYDHAAPSTVVASPTKRRCPFRKTSQSKNRTAFTSMVKVMLRTTLDTIQNRHSGPTRKGNRLPFV